MIVARSEHPQWTSNAYLVADGPGGHGVLIDGNGESHRCSSGWSATGSPSRTSSSRTVTAITWSASKRRPSGSGVPLLRWPDLGDGNEVTSGDLRIRALYTPGHCDDHLALEVSGTDVFTADVLFKGTLGGTSGGGPNGFSNIKHSVMERLMTLDHATRVHPGHTLPTSIGDEWESNPFIRIWRGVDDEGDDPCSVRGEPATLILWAPDYDGTNKAWVRFPDGRDMIIGGSQVQR